MTIVPRFIISLFLGLSLFASAAETRLALVPVDSRCATAADFLTAKFSKSSEIALLERVEVERVLREQNLTARGSAELLRLGHSLGAQGVLVLDAFEQKTATNLTARLIAVRSGVAIGFQSYPLPLKGLDEWSDMIAQYFVGLLPKLGVQANDAIPLSILNLRSTLTTAEGLRLENEATSMLIHRLIAQKEIFVLERQRMTLLGAEKELREVQESPFWNGSYILEGVIERGGAVRDALSIKMRLAASGRPSQTIGGESPEGDLAVLIDRLAAELITRLGKTTNHAPWDPAVEAGRYAQEARWGMRWDNPELARAAADAAWTLGNRSVETALIRVRTELAKAPAMWNVEGASSLGDVSPLVPPETKGLDSLQMSLDNYLSMTPALGTNAGSKAWINFGSGLLEGVAGRLCYFWFYPDRAKQVANELESLREGARELEHLLLRRDNQPGGRAFAVDLASNILQMKITYGWSYAESPEAAIAEIRGLFEAGLSRKQREELIGAPRRWLRPWTDAERARSDARWGSFLDTTIRSTNSLDALTAALMRARGKNSENQQEISRLQYAMAKVMLAHRTNLMCHESRLTQRAMDYLDHRPVITFRRLPVADAVRTNLVESIVTENLCFDDDMLTRLFQIEAFQLGHLRHVLAQLDRGAGTNTPSILRKRFFKAYANRGNSYHDEVFQRLFRAEDYNQSEIRGIISRLDDWRTLDQHNHPENVPAIEKRLALLKSLGTPLRPSAIESAAPTINSEVLNVTRFWAPTFPSIYSGGRTQVVVSHRILQAVGRNEFVWARVRANVQFRWSVDYLRGYLVSNAVFEQFFRIDLKDFSQTKSSPVWKSPTEPVPWNLLSQGVLAARHEGLFFLEESSLSLWDGRAADFRKLDVALPGQLSLQQVGDRFYFGSPDTVLELDPATLAVRTMASRRRNPPLATQDRLPGYGAPTFFKGDGDIVFVTLANRIHPWNIATGTWNEDFTAGPGSLARLPISPTEDSVLYWEGQQHDDRKLKRFTRKGIDEFLLEMKRPDLGPPSSMRRRMPAAAPRWKMPARLSASFVTARDGTNLWAFDRRASTLAFFDSRWEEPLPIQLSLTPGILTNAAPHGDVYELTPLANGLIIFRRLAEGFWFIPQPQLDAALNRMTAAQGPARQIASTPSRPVLVDTNSGWADEVTSNVAQIMRRFSRSRPGALDMGELVAAIGQEADLAGYRSLATGFQSTLLIIDPYDTNGNQRIDAPELDAMIKAGKPTMTREEFMKRWDTNLNGEFDIEEIRAAIAEKQRARKFPKR